MCKRRQSGFTLVELLVVIAIIGILISLLLPAIQAAREAARRAACLNNMTQIGIALASHEAAHESLPPGVTNPTGPIQNVPQGDHMSWITRLLPYMEERVTYEHIDFSLGAYHKKNTPARSISIATLQCPSYDGWNQLFNGAAWESNYAGCHNDVEAPIDVTNRGVFFLNSRIRAKDVTDGTAHTIYVGEKTALPNDLGWMSGTRSTLRNMGTALGQWPLKQWPQNTNSEWGGLSEEDWDIMVASADGSTSEPSESPAEGERTEEPPVDEDMAATEEAVPAATDTPEENANDEPDSQQVTRPRRALFVGGFDSDHAGVTNFLFGDGAVRAISDSINAGIMRQLADRADGKLLTSGPTRNE